MSLSVYGVVYDSPSHSVEILRLYLIVTVSCVLLFFFPDPGFAFCSFTWLQQFLRVSPDGSQGSQRIESLLAPKWRSSAVDSILS